MDNALAAISDFKTTCQARNDAVVRNLGLFSRISELNESIEQNTALANSARAKISSESLDELQQYTELLETTLAAAKTRALSLLTELARATRYATAASGSTLKLADTTPLQLRQAYLDLMAENRQAIQEIESDTEQLLTFDLGSSELQGLITTGLATFVLAPENPTLQSLGYVFAKSLNLELTGASADAANPIDIRVVHPGSAVVVDADGNQRNFIHTSRTFDILLVGESAAQQSVDLNGLATTLNLSPLSCWDISYRSDDLSRLKNVTRARFTFACTARSRK